MKRGTHLINAHGFNTKTTKILSIDGETITILDENNDEWILSIDKKIKKIENSSEEKKSTKKPRGWHWKAEFVDSEGNVYHMGVEKPELKGTLPPTI